ncbi:hypothetical protein [Streptomyces sp. NPDC085540]|uniref:hypothetical protein n=1 Tax=Streptomyces sp. NPDC085540 TaxID=3365730 RepID=UPI0037CFB347
MQRAPRGPRAGRYGRSQPGRFALSRPTREQMRAFLTTLVHDPSLITDELVEERYTQALDPEARI